jgi:glycine cleavage system regulatory protein
VRHDFESWLPKLSRRGIILLHKTNVRDGDFGVWRFWEELRGRYPSFEFLHGHGLGIIAAGETAPAAVLALCWLTDPAAIATLRSRFASIGERWSQVERLESSESALTRAPAELQEMRSQVATLDAEMQARTASSQTELARVETIAADRAMATEMAETAAALKAGELKPARAEIAALSARISQEETVSSGRSARSLRQALRCCGRSGQASQSPASLRRELPMKFPAADHNVLCYQNRHRHPEFRDPGALAASDLASRFSVGPIPAPTVAADLGRHAASFLREKFASRFAEARFQILAPSASGPAIPLVWRVDPFGFSTASPMGSVKGESLERSRSGLEIDAELCEQTAVRSLMLPRR